MAKTNITRSLENGLWRTTSKVGVFGCFEVTIGFGGNERVDYLTYDTKGTWRCYEIKASKEDFYSDAAKTFVGHYNYYVMPRELYEDVKDDIPDHIGVRSSSYSLKNPKRQELAVDEQILKDSLIRSLHREYEKFRKTSDIDYVNRMNRDISRLRNEARQNHSAYIESRNGIFYICEHYDLDYDEVRKLIREY